MRDPFNEIRLHASENPHVEVCGFLLWDGHVGMTAMRARNVSASPQTDVDIHSKDVEEAYRSNRLLGVYHSHTNRSICRGFSLVDLAVSEALQLTSYLFDVVENKIHYYRPKSGVPPLMQRKYVIGHTDCVNLVADWYWTNRGFQIPFAERTLDTLRAGQTLVLKTLVEAGFSIVKDIREGDILTFKLSGCAGINHLGISTGGNYVLHQPFKDVSAITCIPDDWKTSMVALRL